MAKFVCLLVCLAVLVPAAFSLKCYSCNSDKDTGCLKSANPNSVTCSALTAGNKNICIYKHTVTKDNKVAVNSSCGAIGINSGASTLTECIQVPGAPEIKECKICETDLCNSAPGFSTNYLSLLYLPILYFVTRLVAH